MKMGVSAINGGYFPIRGPTPFCLPGGVSFFMPDLKKCELYERVI